MFRHSDIFQMGAFTFATAMMSENRTEAILNPTGLLFKMYRDHFGTIPVEVSGDSPQPKPTFPAGGDQPAVNPGSDTYPLDVSAAFSEDRKTLTIAVLNPSDSEQSMKLAINGVKLASAGQAVADGSEFHRRDGAGRTRHPRLRSRNKTLGAVPDTIAVAPLQRQHLIRIRCSSRRASRGTQMRTNKIVHCVCNRMAIAPGSWLRPRCRPTFPPSCRAQSPSRWSTSRFTAQLWKAIWKATPSIAM